MTDRNYRAARFHDGERYCCALVREGRKRLHVTMLQDSGIVHRAVPMEEARNVEPLPHRGGEYPLQRLVKRFAAIGRERGITEAAKAELNAARA